jgi:hypothetical protein
MRKRQKKIAKKKTASSKCQEQPWYGHVLAAATISTSTTMKVCKKKNKK